MVLEFQRADRVGDLLDRIALAMRVVIHGVDAPLVAGAMMRGPQDTIHDRIAQVDVRSSHVDLGAQRAGAIGELAVLHAFKELQILLDRAIAEGAVGAGMVRRAAMFAHLIGRQVADVGLALLDELDGPFVDLLEIIRRVVEPVPLEADPADILHDGIDVLLLFLLRVGIIEAQVAGAAVLLGGAEVQADRLGMADVQVAIGFGRKARGNPASELATLEIGFDDLMDEVERASRVSRGVSFRRRPRS